MGCIWVVDSVAEGFRKSLTSPASAATGTRPATPVQIDCETSVGCGVRTGGP